MQYKLVACILILSVFSFVLAAPVPVQEVREACANAMEGNDDVIIVSEKRASGSGLGQVEEESDLYPPELSDTESRTSTPSPPQSPSASVDASGNHPGVGMSSSPPAGSTSPLSSKVSSTPDGTGTEAKTEPASSSGPRVSWNPMTKFNDETVQPGETEAPLDQGAFKPGTTTEIQPASSSGPRVSWNPVTKVKFPDEPILAFPPPPRPPPAGRKGYLAKLASQQKGLVGKMKSFFDKVGGKLKFRPRFQRTVDTGAYVSVSSLPQPS